MKTTMKTTKNVFQLESGITTTTPATKYYFEKVNDFYVDFINNKAIFTDITDTTNVLTTSTIIDIEKKVFDDNKCFIKVKTRNSIINLWCNDYDIIADVKYSIKHWREYSWTIYEDKNYKYEAHMIEGIRLSYRAREKEFRVWHTNDKYNFSNLYYITKSIKEAHQIVRMMMMAVEFLDNCKDSIQEINSPEDFDEEYPNNIWLQSENGKITMWLYTDSEGYLRVENNKGKLYLCDPRETVGDNVEIIIREFAE